MNDREGNASFETFFDSMLLRTVDVAYRVVGSRAEAEDVAAEALARAFMSWAKLAELPYRDAWTLRVATNLAIDSVRRRRLSLDRDPTSHDFTEDAADRMVVRDAIRSLPRRQRDVVALRYFADLSTDDAAHALGMAVGTLKSHQARALRSLRNKIGRPLDLKNKVVGDVLES